ncbi:MAG: glycoside hydrolase family 97 C-terminal domain-containing protein [Kiritimatiellae bacterium]|nr:glycoside hydrolase family 97 C-terminal domain-containing protein [Kiritimatiellia bacterium]
MKHIVIESADKSVCASLSLESFWSGNTVFPSAPVFEVSYKQRQIIKRSQLVFQPVAGQPISHGLEIIAVKKQRPKTRFGPGRQVVIRLRERHGLKRELEITLRLSAISVFCSLHQPRKRTNIGCDRSDLQFVDGAVLHSVKSEMPLVAFAPSSVLFAYWNHANEHHLVILDRPGAIAEMQFGALGRIESLDVESGADGCRQIYSRLPFTKAALPVATYGEDIRSSFKEAFDALLGHYQGGDDDFWLIRGEPGVFAIGARRSGANWMVAGITAKARTLTLRFEDLWLRMPQDLRAAKWRVKIARDTVRDEPGERIEESFEDLAPDIRVALDLKKNGGFTMDFKPYC